MNKQQQSALAVAVAAAVGGIAGEAQAARYTATLKSVASYAGAGSSAGNIASSTATWEYNDVTDQLTQTGGTFNVRFTITPSTTLFRHSITSLVIGNGGAATAATYTCTEGGFGTSVGASLCGNYNFGANSVNESTVSWGPGTTTSRTLGGDDMALGPEQSVTAYSSFTTSSFTGTSVVLSNATCNPFAPGNANGCATLGGLNTGYTWTLENLTQLAEPVNDTVQVQMGTPAQIAVLANDGPVADPATVTITGAATQGSTTVNGSPGDPDNISVTYTPTSPTFTGTDSFVYEVQAANIPGGVGTAVVNITVVDTIPDNFSFTALTDVPLSSVQTSEAVQITGISDPAPISVTNGQYSIGCGSTFTPATGTINPGDTVCVQQTASASPLTPTSATLSVGGVDGVFTVTTVAADVTPDDFTFTAATDVVPGTQVTSNTVVINGIDAPASISVTGGEYSLGCSGTFTAADGTITAGESVCVRQTASTSGGATTTAELTVGTVARPFSVTTLVPDTEPDAFTIAPKSDVTPGSQVTSDPVTISGINVPAPISVTGGEYSVGCNGTFVSTDGTINPGDSVCVRQTASSNTLTTTVATLTIGGVAGPFSVTTADIVPDTTPDPFTFDDQPNVPKSTVITSDPVTITGINVAVPITVQNGTYSIGCTDTFTSDPGTITDGQTVCVQQTSASSSRTAVTTILSVGDPAVSDAFSSSTGGGGGSSSVDGLMAGLLGLLGLARLRRRK